MYGKRNGIQMFYSLDGNVLFKGSYTDDKKDGKHYFYDEEGFVYREEIYSNGIPEGVWKYYDKRVLRKKLFYKNGELIKSEVVK